jgi:hypothetical protein
MSGGRLCSGAVVVELGRRARVDSARDVEDSTRGLEAASHHTA